LVNPRYEHVTIGIRSSWAACSWCLGQDFEAMQIAKNVLGKQL